MELNNIPKTGNYGSGVDLHNDNYSKIGLKLETLENMPFNEKGYFETLTALEAKYPTPQSGWQAYVKDAGSSTGYYVANVNSSGNWVVTSAEAPAVGVNLNDYALNGGSEKTVKEVEDEIVQLAGEVTNNYVAKESGKGLMSDEQAERIKDIINTEPANYNLFNDMAGYYDRVINNSGEIVNAIGWYVSPPMYFDVNENITINRSRSWAQYDDEGNVVSAWYSANSTPILQTITRHPEAVYVRSSTTIAVKHQTIANYGDTIKPFIKFELKLTDIQGVPIVPITNAKNKSDHIKQMFLSESFVPNGVTYTDGLIDSPFSLVWADRATGSMSITRDNKNLALSVTATHIDDETTTLTCTITRDANGNATNSIITIS